MTDSQPAGSCVRVPFGTRYWYERREDEHIKYTVYFGGIGCARWRNPKPNSHDCELTVNRARQVMNTVYGMIISYYSIYYTILSTVGQNECEEKKILPLVQKRCPNEVAFQKSCHVHYDCVESCRNSTTVK